MTPLPELSIPPKRFPRIVGSHFALVLAPRADRGKVRHISAERIGPCRKPLLTVLTVLAGGSCVHARPNNGGNPGAFNGRKP